MRRRGAAALVGLVLVAPLVACGDDDAAPPTEPGVTTTLPEGPVAGGVLRLGLGVLASLDPAAARPDSPSSAIAADILFDGLTTLGAGESAASPGVAAEWATTDDGATWRFELDGGRTFSDGSAVTAADVELSLERVVSQGSASLTASRLDTVSGYEAFLEAGGLEGGADLAGVEATGPTTVEVRLDRPMASLPELLAAPSYGVVSAAGVEADGSGFASAPSVTSGPFRIAASADAEPAEGAAEVLVLERAPGREPLLDGIELHEFESSDPAYDALVAEQLDWSLVSPADAVAAAGAFGDEHITPFQAERFFGFNLADERFADVRFRMAIARAFDRAPVRTAIESVAAGPLGAVVPSGVPGADPARCGETCIHDTDAARALLAEIFPDGDVPTVPLDYPDVPSEAAAAAVLAGELEEAGIPVELRPHPAEEYSTFAVSGEQGFASLGWVGVQAIAEDYVSRLFRSGGTDNQTGLADPDVDALLDEAARTLDVAERTRLVGEAEAAVLALVAVVPVAQFRVLAAAGPRVHDFALGLVGTFDAERVWLR